HFLCALLIEADTDQSATCIVDSPITPSVPLDRHGMCSPRRWGRACTLPLVDVTGLCTSGHQRSCGCTKYARPSRSVSWRSCARGNMGCRRGQVERLGAV